MAEVRNEARNEVRKEYIEREAVIENLNRFAPECYNALVNQLIIKQPTADVVEVRRGEWKILKNYPQLLFACSNCDFNLYYGMKLHSNFCPNCGADMRGETNDNRAEN